MKYIFGHRQVKRQKNAVAQFRTVAAKKFRFFAMTLSALTCGAAVLIGCSHPGGSGSHSGSGGGSGSGSGPAVDVTGNWQITLSPTAPISTLAGYLSQQGTGNNEFTTAALQAHTTGCFTDATTVPMSGQTSGTDVNLSSFVISGQTLSLNVQANTAGNQFSGTYSIAGGCAGGTSGKVTGTEYAPLGGTYTGSITGSSPAVTLSLALSQETVATGLGVFPMSGSATFTGISCFSQGTLSAQNGSVLGDTVTMDFTTNGSAEVQMTGTFDTAASTVTLSSIQVSGSSCSGSLGTATLTRQ